MTFVFNLNLQLNKLTFVFVHCMVFLELWLEWINDEKSVATTPEERKAINNYFERAIKDYLCKYKQ